MSHRGRFINFSLTEDRPHPPQNKLKLQDKYSDAIVDWEKIYSLAFSVTLESKLREFQYKILNCIELSTPMKSYFV